MKNPVSILAMLGDASAYGAIVEWIRRRGLLVSIVITGADGLRLHRETGAELVIVGLPLPDQTASTLLAELRRQDPGAIIVVVGADADVNSQLQALELGAHDYIADPVDGKNDVLFALGVSLGMRAGDTHLRVLRDRDAATAEWRAIVANCRPMRQIMARLRAICDRSTGAAPTVLLTGELGTGKRLTAKAIHYNGSRRNRVFAEVNCTAISAHALHAQLFGYERGAFPEARSMRRGLFETVEGGTVFLEEVGALAPALQGELLAAIEDKQIHRLGGSTPVSVDVQIVAATRRDLAAMVKTGELRADLYHRLNVVMVELPPLRDRGDDIVTLAESMIEVLATEQGLPVPVLAADAREAIKSHRWPGNLRELRNELERIVLMVDDTIIRAEHFRARPSNATVAIDGSNVSLDVKITGDLCPLERVEQEVIRQALIRSGGVSRAARYLAITRQTLLYRMKKYGFASPSTHPGDVEEKDAP